MSQREFENYLVLLAGLLRLSAKQRDEISGELRDHFEERLEELTARGISRDEAIQRTLAEFGDAAGLAAAFLHVSRNRRKRWIMKWTAASIGGLAAMALLAVALWPENANVKLTPKAVAQPPAAEGGAAAKKDEAKSKEDNNAATEAVLARQIAADFVETPLADVIEFLSDLTAVEFYVNWKKLEEDGIARDAPISIRLKKVRLDMLLDLALAQAGESAAYVLRDGIVVVSSAANLENATEIRVYNCRDLLKHASSFESGFSGGDFGSGPGGVIGPATPGPGPGSSAPPGAGSPPPGAPGPGGPSGLGSSGLGGALGLPGGMGGYGGGIGGDMMPASRADPLIHMLTTAVAPNSWDGSGGFGTVSEFSGLLVINHNARTHRQIEKVLGMLRESIGKDTPAKGPAAPAKK
jgi:hypothetical protein